MLWDRGRNTQEDVNSVLLETDATGYLYKQSTMRRMWGAKKRRQAQPVRSPSWSELEVLIHALVGFKNWKRVPMLQRISTMTVSSRRNCWIGCGRGNMRYILASHPICGGADDIVQDHESELEMPTKTFHFCQLFFQNKSLSLGTKDLFCRFLWQEGANLKMLYFHSFKHCWPNFNWPSFF